MNIPFQLRRNDGYKPTAKPKEEIAAPFVEFESLGGPPLYLSDTLEGLAEDSTYPFEVTKGVKPVLYKYKNTLTVNPTSLGQR